MGPRVELIAGMLEVPRVSSLYPMASAGTEEWGHARARLPAEAADGNPGEGIVKLLQKTIRMCNNKKAIRHFLPSRPPVFSPSVACQVCSRGRGRSAIFVNLTMPPEGSACPSWVYDAPPALCLILH